METVVGLPECETPLCTNLAKYYTPGVEKYSCSSWYPALFSKLDSVFIPKVEKVQESITAVHVLLSNVDDFLERHRDCPLPQLSERLSEWRSKLEELNDRLRKIPTQKKYYDLKEIGVDAISMKNSIQDEDVYKEFLLAQENKTINLKILRGLFYEDVQEAISYDQYLISIGTLKDDLKKAYEQKIEQIQTEQTNHHREQIEQLTSSHTTETQRFQNKIQAFEQEIRDLNELTASIKNESKSKIDELSQNLLDSKEEYEKAVEALTNKVEEHRNTIQSMTQNYKDRLYELSSQNTHLSSVNDSLQIKIVTMKDTHKADLNQLRVENSSLEVKNDDLTNQNKALKDKVDSLETQANELSKELQSQKEDYKNKVSELSSKNDELKKTVEDSKTEVQYLKILTNPLFYQKKELRCLMDNFYQNPKERFKEFNMLKEGSKLTIDQWNFIVESLSFEDKALLKNSCIHISEDEITINFKKDLDMNLMKILSNFILPKWINVRFENVGWKNEEVSNLLLNLKFGKRSGFIFNSLDEDEIEDSKDRDEKILVKDIGSFIDGLKQACKLSGLENFTIFNWKVTSEQIVHVFSSAKHCKEICFYNCQLLLDEEFNFGDSLEDAEFKSINLRGSEDPKYSDFKSNPQRLENLLKALGKVQAVRDNLKKVVLDTSELDKELLYEMAEQSQLQIWCDFGLIDRVRKSYFNQVLNVDNSISIQKIDNSSDPKEDSKDES